MDFEDVLDLAVRLFEAAGVGILVLGGLISVVVYARDLSKAAIAGWPTRRSGTTWDGRSCSASRSSSSPTSS